MFIWVLVGNWISTVNYGSERNQMLKLIFFILLISVVLNAYSNIEEFTREYTYNASENDSKVTARKSAMQQLQSIVIQEVGIQIQSNFSNKEILRHDDFVREIKIQQESFSHAFTKTKILEEKWDGENFYIKAIITVDTDNLSQKIKSVYDKEVVEVDTCDTKSKKVLNLLKKSRSDQAIKELVTLSKENSFDWECNYWQYQIMKSFSKTLTDNEGYRNNLFNVIEKAETPLIANELVTSVLQYALKIKPLSDEEWRIVKNNILSTSSAHIKSIVSAFIVNTKNPVKIKNNVEEKLESRKQEYSSLNQKMSELVFEAKNGSFLNRDSITNTNLVLHIIRSSMQLQPKLAYNYFVTNVKKFDQSQKNSLISPVIKRYKNHKNKESYHMIELLISNIEINYRASKLLYPLFEDMEKMYSQGTHSKFYDFSVLINEHKNVVEKVLSLVKINKDIKIGFSEKYKIQL